MPAAAAAPRVLMARMLGNDLAGLHGEAQTLDNLRFTLMHEASPPEVTEVFVLNRIVDAEKRRQLRALLDAYGVEHAEIPYEPEALLRLGRPAADAGARALRAHNLYAVNNNACRNWCIDYGRANGFDWTFVLDSNSFFLADDLRAILRDLRALDPAAEGAPHYLAFHQARLKDRRMQNEDLLRADAPARVRALPSREPQLAFHRRADVRFHPKIPYGSSPKAELLQVLGVQGEWATWGAHLEYVSARRTSAATRARVAVRAERAVRLHPQHEGNDFRTNKKNRERGLLQLVPGEWRAWERRCQWLPDASAAGTCTRAWAAWARARPRPRPRRCRS